VGPANRVANEGFGQTNGPGSQDGAVDNSAPTFSGQRVRPMPMTSASPSTSLSPFHRRSCSSLLAPLLAAPALFADHRVAPVLAILVLAIGGNACVTKTVTLAEYRPAIVSQVSDWVAGDPVPVGLLRFRESGGLLASSDTVAVMRDIESVPLLLALLASPAADDHVLGLAIERLFLLTGPVRTFRELAALVARDPEQGQRRPLSAALHRAKYAHVWAEGVFVREDDMTREAGLALLTRVREQLELGRPMALVYRVISREEAYRPATGPHRGQWRTRLGNFGNYVLGPPEAGPPIDRGALVPAAHLELLLASTPGSIVVADHEVEKERMLYQVHELYTPDSRAAQQDMNVTRDLLGGLASPADSINAPTAGHAQRSDDLIER
jgi:hypothetical protein